MNLQIMGHTIGWQLSPSEASLWVRLSAENSAVWDALVWLGAIMAALMHEVASSIHTIACSLWSLLQTPSPFSPLSLHRCTIICLGLRVLLSCLVGLDKTVRPLLWTFSACYFLCAVIGMTSPVLGACWVRLKRQKENPHDSLFLKTAMVMAHIMEASLPCVLIFQLVLLMLSSGKLMSWLVSWSVMFLACVIHSCSHKWILFGLDIMTTQ